MNLTEWRQRCTETVAKAFKRVGTSVEPAQTAVALLLVALVWGAPMKPEAVLGLVAAIADGVPVDWEAAESQAKDEKERRLIRKLRDVAQIVQALRAGRGGGAASLGGRA